MTSTSPAAASATPLRIVLVVSGYPPDHRDGYELYAHDVARSLVKRGHTVTVVTARGRGKGVADEKGVRVVRALRREAGGERRFGLLAARASCKVVRRELRRIDANVLLFFKQTGLCGALLGMRPRAGGVALDISSEWLLDTVASGGNWFGHWENRSPSPALRLAGRTYARVVSVLLGVPVDPPAVPPGPLWFTDRELWKRHLAAGLKVQGAELVTPGVDLRQFKFVPERPENGPKKILFYGGLRRKRGLHTAVLALRDVPGDAVLRVVGAVEDPGYLAECAEMGRAGGVMGRIQIGAAVPTSELPALLANSDVLLYPSEEPKTFPRLILEGFAVGTPVVGTALGGAAEALLDDQTGLVFDPGNAHALARQLRRVIEEPGLSERLALKARHLVEKRYAIGYTVEQMEPVLREAAG